MRTSAAERESMLREEKRRLEEQLEAAHSSNRYWRGKAARFEQEWHDLFNEVDCRVEHGANSGGHLEYVRDRMEQSAERLMATSNPAREPDASKGSTDA